VESPPFPQPLVDRRVASATAVRRVVQKVVRRVWWGFLQKRKRVGVRRQRMMLPSWLWFGVEVFFERVMEVTVWIVATAFCGAPLRGMLEGTIEQVAESAGAMGVQLRTTVPAKLLMGVRVRL
jgi:hypothetical protein